MLNVGGENRKNQRLLSIEELAEYLGVKVNTLYSWVHTRKIPYIKVGRLVKFCFWEVDQWLEHYKVRPWNEEHH